MRMKILITLLTLALSGGSTLAQQASPQVSPQPKVTVDPMIPPQPTTMPLYPGEIPNSTNAPDQEETHLQWGREFTQKVSRPTLACYLPAKIKAAGSAIIIFPGGGYIGEVYQYEGTSIAEAFRDHGVAAFIVKYRVPSDVTMKDKSIDLSRMRSRPSSRCTNTPRSGRSIRAKSALSASLLGGILRQPWGPISKRTISAMGPP